MATDIIVWPGSSSFFPGDTPFELYDNDLQFQYDAPRVAEWTAKRLGYPITDIELQDCNFFACFEEAVSEYGAQLNTFNIRDNMLNLYGSSTGSSTNLSGRTVSPNFGGLIELAKEYGTEAGSGGNVTYYTGSITISSSQQMYDLTDTGSVTFEQGTPGVDDIEIKRVFHAAPPAIVRYFDPYAGSGLGTQQMLDGFGWGGLSTSVSFMMMPVYFDALRVQAIEFNDQIRKSAFTFELINNRIRFFPIPNGTNFRKVYFQYILKADRANALKGTTGTVSDFSNVPYESITYKTINAVGKQWIRRYTLALAKEMLGYVRSKYSSLPIPNAEITLNGDQLVSAAEAEKQELIEELKEILDSMSRQAQLERKQAEAESMQQQLAKIPTKIYIG
jgi:hypothetical protein